MSTPTPAPGSAGTGSSGQGTPGGSGGPAGSVTTGVLSNLRGCVRRGPFVVEIDGARLRAGRHHLRADVRLRAPRSGRRFKRRLVLRFTAC